MSLALTDRYVSRRPHEVRPGELYRRSKGKRMTELATVLELRQDPFGITHVRFDLAFERPDAGRFEGGTRILALRAFIATYRERVR